MGLLFPFFLGVFYVVLDKKVGSLAIFVCLVFWLRASSTSVKLGYSLAWKSRLHQRFPGQGKISDIQKHLIWNLIVTLTTQNFSMYNNFISNNFIGVNLDPSLPPESRFEFGDVVEMSRFHNGTPKLNFICRRCENNHVTTPQLQTASFMADTCHVVDHVSSMFPEASVYGG
ncbi:hypothetical protein F3Y22_tig00003041pilonHSYRG00427 [Hibiscus syriacus]|uniref:Uncharacterized protein n=1 Tax=Hibiscus syriacus TaxID=106335 RepID=A0A6A3CS40_HIBSY|nr:hypothetical protein F3Y22_tig00003041pilonHSYRG00427 [Hibiscus syriacus]